MFARLCKNSIFPTSHPTSACVRNEYRLPTESNQLSSSASPLRRRELPEIPHQDLLYRREPPPPYWAQFNNPTVDRVEPPQIPLRPPPRHRHRVPNPNLPLPSQSSRSPLGNRRVRVTVSDTESDNENQRVARNPRSPPKNECLLDEDLFCPDLVRTCKSIIQPDDEQDYIEIEELISSTSRLQLNPNNVGIPIVETRNKVTTTRVMGQTLKKPKISLTWVLREQQAQQPKTNTSNSKTWSGSAPDKLVIERKKPRSRSRSHDRSDKYHNENNRATKISIEETASHKSLSTHRKKTERIERKTGKIVKKNRFDENNCCNKSNSSNDNNSPIYNDGQTKLTTSTSHMNLSTKNTYSEPSIYQSVSESGQLRRHRRRKRHRSPKFGYEIKNVDEFLSKCSLSSPANIPVVLSTASTLYQTRTGYQIEIPLPLGMVVNSIFKNQNWLYVQTPHAEEGYVSFSACLPLGILPQNQRNNGSTKPWESSKDIFPKPCGNLTDSEKEIQMRGSGTRSEGRRTPKLKKSNRSCSEKNLDSLYLRAASQPKLVDPSYALLKPTSKCKTSNFQSVGDYVLLKQQKGKSITTNSNSSTNSSNLKSSLGQTQSIRQTLLAITDDYSSESVTVRKGDVVSLLACKEYQEKGSANYRQWFYIRNRDGSEGYIPAEVAGHGFL